MTVRKIVTPERYEGLAADTRPTHVRAGTTYYATDTGILYITTDDGTTWAAKEVATVMTGKAEDAAHTSSDYGIMLLAVRSDTAAALAGTTGDYIPLIVDANGRLHVLDQNSAAMASSLALLDNAIAAGNELQVDVVAALPAGTNAIGKLAANTGVDIGDVDVTSISAGTNLIGKVGIDQATANANEVVLKASTAAIGKLAANTGVDIGDVDILSIAAGNNNIGDVDVASITAGTNVIGKVRLVTTAGDEITDDTQDDIKTHRGKAGLSNSGVKSADAVIKASAGAAYWMSVSDTAALSIELNNSTDNGGTDVWAAVLPANNYAHYIFDPPIECSLGIYLDVSTATCKVVVGYI